MLYITGVGLITNKGIALVKSRLDLMRDERLTGFRMQEQVQCTSSNLRGRLGATA
jgi:hypothetical protein